MFCNPDVGKEFDLKWELLSDTNKQYSQFHDISLIRLLYSSTSTMQCLEISTKYICKSLKFQSYNGLKFQEIKNKQTQKQKKQTIEAVNL